MKTRLMPAGALAALCAVALTGCENWAHRNSRQGHELEQILKEDRKILTEVPKNLPVQFEPVAIERQARESGIHYRAVLLWKLVGTRTQAEQALTRLAGEQAVGTVGRPVQSVELRIRYVNLDGKLCDFESVVLNVSQASGSIELSSLGKTCSPSRLIAEVAGLSFVPPPRPVKEEPKQDGNGDFSK